jgi:hypothetical protein
MSLEANILIFLTPTHMHIFYNHRNSYGRSRTLLIQSVSGSLEI